MTTAQSPYALGHDDAELDRLVAQSRFLGDLSGHLLSQAGLRPGMRVVDVGCGVGDVTFLAARLVGREGFVTGIDRSPEAVDRARQRADEARLTNVAFVVGDATELTLESTVDAIVGRLVLMYLPDPAAVLRRLRGHLSPGGVMTFQEMDMGGVFSNPSSPLLEQTTEWVRETFRRVGANTRAGLDLYRVFGEAGLPAPTMLQAARVEAGPDTELHPQLAAVVRTLLPHIERTGVATAAEVDIDTLAARLRTEALALGAVAIWPPLIGAWATV